MAATGTNVSRTALSRQIALDHILRRLIQQNPRQSASVQLWNSIARLIPGVTVQHCAQRWHELWEEVSVVRDQTQLEAMGRPISSQPRSHSARSAHQLSLSTSSTSIASSIQPCPRDSAAVKKVKMVDSKQLQAAVDQVAPTEEGGGGSEACDDTKEDAKATPKGAGDGETVPSNKPSSSPVVSEESSPPHGTDTASATDESTNDQMVTIHVFDDAKNVKQDFVCSRSLLVEEMVYFADYLSNQPSDCTAGVDISVHCDVAIFTWLMSYVKKGLKEDPFWKKTEQPQETPTLNPENVISVLISSEFLKMAALVEMCLDFLHSHLSAVLSTKCNVGCIRDSLVTRLARKFTPMELEGVQDKKDRFRNKLYLKKLVDLFKCNFSAPYSPNNAATLYRCLHCNMLLTVDQEDKLPCSSKRVSVSAEGEIVYLHQVDPQWDVNSYLALLLANGRTIREVYWMVWGVVNTLVCDRCGQLFQCRHLQERCYCHPALAVPSPGGTAGPVYPCCGRRHQFFRILNTQQDGCQLEDHCVTAEDGTAGDSGVASILLAHQDIICNQDTEEQDTVASTISEHPTLKDLLSSTPVKTAELEANRVLWDPKRTIRWNQDRQREQDQLRILKLAKQLREMADREKLTI